MRLRISYVWSSSSVFKGRHVHAEVNAEPSQSTDSNEERERGSTNIGIQRLSGWSSLLHIVELSAKLAASGLSHAAARWLGGVLRRL